MSNPTSSQSDPHTDADEALLDPAAARAVAKVRMLALVGGLTMMLGIGAIFAVIGYRVFKADGSAPVASMTTADAPDGTVVLPPEARVVATTIGSDRLVVTVEIDGATELRLFDLQTLAPAGRLRLVRQQP
jgi:hypothetical protein